MWVEALCAALLCAAAGGSWLGTQKISARVSAAILLLPAIGFAAFLYFLLLFDVKLSDALSAAAMATTVVCVATVAAMARRKGLLRVLTEVAVAVVLFVVFVLPLLAGATVTIFLKYVTDFTNYWFAYTLSWTLGYAVTAIFVTRHFHRSVRAGNPRALPSVAMLLTASGAGFVLLLGTFGNLDASAKLKLENVRMEGAAQALSVAPARIPDRDNAALLYQKAFEAFDMVAVKPMVHGTSSQYKQTNWYDLGAADYPAGDPQLRDYLERNKPALAILRRATALADCYFHRDYCQPLYAMPLPELTKLRQASRLLGASARCRAAAGNIKGALEDIAAIRNLARHACDEPFLISTLVGIAIDSMATGALEGILCSTRPATADLAALRAQERVSFPRAIQRSFRGEEASGLAVFALLGSSDGNLLEMLGVGEDPVGITLALPFIRVFLLEDDIAAYRTVLGNYKALAALPFHEARERWKGMESSHSQLSFITKLIAPVLIRAAESGARGEVMSRLAELGVAAAAFHALKGHYPGTLEELVPDFISHIPIDSYNGQPLRMKTSREGVIFYGVGADLKDDGGTPFKNDDWATGDATFRVGSRMQDNANVPPTGVEPIPSNK